MNLSNFQQYRRKQIEKQKQSQAEMHVALIQQLHAVNLETQPPKPVQQSPPSPPTSTKDGLGALDYPLCAEILSAPVIENAKAFAPEHLQCHHDQLPQQLVKIKYHVDELGHGKLSDKARAIPLVLPNNMTYDERTGELLVQPGIKRTHLELDAVAVKIIEQITLPIAVLSIAGMARRRKSYFLARLVQQHHMSMGKQVPNPEDLFQLGHTHDAKTFGIWMWSDPIVIELSSKQKVALLLLDTEGTDHFESNYDQDSKILALSVLCSSLFVYNSSGQPRSTDLDKLSFVSTLAQHLTQNTTSPTIPAFYPDLVWLIRDFVLQSKIDEEQSTLHEYIIRHTLKDDADTTSENAIIRRSIKSFFTSISGYDIPFPSTDSTVMLDMFRNEDKLNPLFLERIDAAIGQVLALIRPKHGIDSAQALDGKGFLVMLQVFVSALNDSKRIPSLLPLWQAAQRVAYANARTEALSHYRNSMQTSIQETKRIEQMPLEFEQLLEIHGNAFSSAIRNYVAGLNQFVAGAESLSKNGEFMSQLDELKRSIVVVSNSEANDVVGGIFLNEYLQPNYVESRAHCEQVGRKLIADQLARLTAPGNLNQELDTDSQGLAKYMEQAQITVHEFMRLYEASARGPAKAQVLKSLVKEISDRASDEILLHHSANEAQSKRVKHVLELLTAEHTRVMLREQEQKMNLA